MKTARADIQLANSARSKFSFINRVCRISSLAAILLLLVFTYAGNAATINVGYNEVSDFSVIQDAINNADPGDIIEVRNGTYYENIILNKSLFLKGINKPLISGNGNDSIITITSDHCIIDGFELTGSGTISNNTKIDSAIFIGSLNNRISNNSLFENYAGICLFETGLNDINNNSIFACENGIYLLNSSNNTIYGNYASNCLNSGDEKKSQFKFELCPPFCISVIVKL